MVQRKTGFAVSWQSLSPILGIFRVQPAAGSRFPEYEAGQYIALRREDCALTRRVTDADGQVRYVPDLDATGVQRRGPVSHAYSISSAPYETQQEGFLEFYVVRELDEEGRPGRLTESLFRIEPGRDDQVVYFDRIAGDFTLAKRAAGFRHVLMVASGSGLAPFVSIVKQLHFEAGQGRRDATRYTLLHGNRTAEELAYHRDLEAVAGEGRIDIAYVATVSRPARTDHDPSLGRGRVSNVLRLLLGLPMKEEEDAAAAEVKGGGVEAARNALAKAVRPTLPAGAPLDALRERFSPADTVLMTCGNASAMADVQTAAEARGIRFEKEDWKPTLYP
jgi:ferredoxin-NADP reductase